MIYVALLIAMTGQASARYYWTPQDFGVQPQFIIQSTLLSTPEQRSNGREIPVGLRSGQFEFAINEVYKRMLKPDLDHVPGRKLDALAKLIQNGTDEVIQRLGLGAKPPLLRKWLLAEATCDWVSTHVVYDAGLVNADSNTKIRRANPEIVLQQDPLTAICSGQTALAVALAKAVGIDATHLGGEAIFYGEPRPKHDNHGWALLNFGDGVVTAADVSQGAMSLSDMRRIGGKMNWDYLLPKSPMELELFLAKHYAYGPAAAIDESKDFTANVNSKTSFFALTTIEPRAWHAIDTTYLKEVWKKYREAEYQKVKWLNSFQTIDDPGLRG